MQCIACVPILPCVVHATSHVLVRCTLNPRTNDTMEILYHQQLILNREEKHLLLGSISNAFLMSCSARSKSTSCMYA